MTSYLNKISEYENIAKMGSNIISSFRYIYLYLLDYKTKTAQNETNKYSIMCTPKLSLMVKAIP